MTHFRTARINDLLGLQIGVVREIALRLDGKDLELLERDLSALEEAIKTVRSTAEGLSHRHQA